MAPKGAHGPRPRRYLIVNADDFGLTHGVNDAVEAAHSRGLLTSTTVIVNGSGAPAVGEASRRWPELDFGLHVNLTLGRPVADPSTVRSLVDADGLFRRDVLRRSLLGRVVAREIFREVQAQAELLTRLGASPVHWDSHQGVGFWPALVRPIAAACQAAGLRCARSPRVWSAARSPRVRIRASMNRAQHPKALAVEAGALLSRARLARAFRMPDWRTSPHLAGAAVDYRRAWDQTLASLPSGATEIVCHPAHVDADLELLTPGLVAERAVDLSVLSDPDRRTALEAAGVMLIGFRHLLD